MEQVQIHIRDVSISKHFSSKWGRHFVYYYQTQSNRGGTSDEFD